MTHCNQCNTEYTVRSYPRFLRSKRDRMWCEANQKPVEVLKVGDKSKPYTWVERFFCDCGWRLNLHLVDVQLLEQLLPDYHAQQEIRRRAA